MKKNLFLNKKTIIKLISLFVFILLPNKILAEPYYSNTVPVSTNTNSQTQQTNISKNNNLIIDKSILDNITIGDLLKSNITYGESLSDINAKIAVINIGTKLKKNAGINKNVYFSYSKEEIENAESSATGNIIIYRGLLNLCEIEDELAFVIAHELAHAANYHGVKSIGLQTTNDISDKAGSIISDNSSNWILGTAATIALKATTLLASSKYAKTLENDADIIAVDYVVKSGYNPLAGLSILYKSGEMYNDLLASHESLEKRINNVYSYIKSKYPQYLNSPIQLDSYYAAVNLISD